MKKTLLTAALFSVMGLNGLNASAAESSIIYGYSGQLSNNVSAQQANVRLGGAMYIPAEVAAQWAEANISGLRIGFGYGSANEVNVFVSEKLGGTAIYSQKAEMKVEQWNDVKFTEPLEVPADGFYIGYEVTTKDAQDFPIAVDNLASPITNSAYIGINGQWNNYASNYGSVCLRVLVDGEDLPENDLSVVGTPVISKYVGVNNELPISVTVTNNGSQPVESISVSCLINGDELLSDVSCTLSPASIAPGEVGVVTFNDIVLDEKGENLKVDLDIATVNGGEDANPSNNLTSGTVTVLSETFARNFVVEEWTGTWCGNCPVGIVGLGKMQEKYGNDRFIGIAVHGGQANEPMATSSYNGFIQAFCNGGYPGCIINRNRNLIVYPAYEILDYYYNDMENQLTYANVEITDIDLSGAENGKIAVTSETKFSLSNSNAKYRMAYVLLEDHVGPYPQSNYFAGGGMGQLDGWESKGSMVEWYFNEVARWIQNALGVNNSIPTSVEEGEVYEYTCQLPITNVTDLGNCSVVAMLLNSVTGEVENATKLKLPVEAGVEGIFTEDVKVAAGKGELRVFGDYKRIDVYTVAGRKVASSEIGDNIPLAAGMYIYNVCLLDGTTKSGKVLVY